MQPAYFDHNATTPVLPRVFAAMRPYLEEHFGNPGSCHMWGLHAKRAVDRARERVAALLGCAPESVCFTGGATESNNLVLQGAFHPGFAADPHRRGLVVSAVEHPAVLGPAALLQDRGARVARVGVGQDGAVRARDVLAACDEGTRLISLMLANNETGVLQPVAEVARLARERGILVHTDAAQAVGKIPVDVRELDVDFLSVAGHKMYAPKGVGALYVRPGLDLPPLCVGGGQEGGLRPGTENVPYMVALGEACALAQEDLEGEARRQRELGSALLRGLQSLGRDFVLHGRDAPRLPNTACVGFAGVAAGDVLSGLLGQDVAASAGAACHSGETALSHVLAAMGADPDYAAGTIRFSWGRQTTQDTVTDLLSRLERVFSELS
jgi:cysteine desulfurase